jgi:3'(2'), 5'-bisphosphate nucleotidase
MNYSEELPHIITVAREAGRIVMQCRTDGIEISTKSGEYDFLTTADVDADTYIVGELNRVFPDDDILSEESGLRGTYDGRIWMVDPIDGTKNFAHGGDMFSVMIGLCVDGDPVLGVVYSPTDDVLYYATKGRGAYLQKGDIQTRLLVSNISQLSDARLVTRVRLDKNDSRPFDQIEEAMPIGGRIPMSSGGLKIGLIASDQADVCVAFNPLIGKWDTCAPQIILEEAGGIYTDGDGKALDYRKKGNTWGMTLIASNGEVHQKILEYLKNIV